ncbi:MAG: FAD-dependent oxidoreductase, partial [Ktedonobacteraceae bacterium]|nr:FAD-dependent oxidoreductase [Ktedonobacteraceae bacterium]
FNLEPETRVKGNVVVVGGGSTALDAARSALRAGAQSVQIVYRRRRAEMPAQHEEVEAALSEGIELHELATPQSILGTEEATVRSIVCQRMQLGELDEKGRRRSVKIPGESFTLEANIILVAIGEAPDPSFLPRGTSIEIAAWGGLLINKETLSTGVPGVFAAGDVTYGPKTIIQAAAHGRKAAQSIHAYLRKRSIRNVAEMPSGEVETASLLPPGGRVNVDLSPTPRAIMPLLRYDAIKVRSAETAQGFTEEQARREGSRCLRCDLAYLCPTITDTSKAVEHAQTRL